jgi:hypothetical protein
LFHEFLFGPQRGTQKETGDGISKERLKESGSPFWFVQILVTHSLACIPDRASELKERTSSMSSAEQIPESVEPNATEEVYEVTDTDHLNARLLKSLQAGPLPLESTNPDPSDDDPEGEWA